MNIIQRNVARIRFIYTESKLVFYILPVLEASALLLVLGLFIVLQEALKWASLYYILDMALLTYLVRDLKRTKVLIKEEEHSPHDGCEGCLMEHDKDEVVCNRCCAERIQDEVNPEEPINVEKENEIKYDIKELDVQLIAVKHFCIGEDKLGRIIRVPNVLQSIKYPAKGYLTHEEVDTVIAYCDKNKIEYLDCELLNYDYQNELKETKHE